ncbi:MAG: methylated-DNA--[protein]-cysteine S-methyltransferase [Christensenellales bacterium]
MREAALMETPLGQMLAIAEDGQLRSLDFVDQPPFGLILQEGELMMQVRRQLAEYFSGKLRHFSLPLAPVGTPFQQQVWAALREIPYGQTRSYRDIARAIGKPSAMRAVGGANHRNPIAVITPCHRVIGADGTLVGYGGGLDRKRALLALESAALQP